MGAVSTSPTVEVIQADRDIVQSFRHAMLDKLMTAARDKKAGARFGEDEGDEGALVQHFARHRLSAERYGVEVNQDEDFWTALLADRLGADRVGCWRCGPLADVLACILRLEGHEAVVVQGLANGEHHAWVQIGAKVCDPTAGQFTAPITYTVIAGGQS